MIDVSSFFQIYKDTPVYPNMDLSVHKSSYRLDKAKEQAQMPAVPVETIIGHTNDFLRYTGIETVDHAVFELTGAEIDYDKIKQAHGLQDVRDIVWMKFTGDGYLGVVAASNDVNFDIPGGEQDYHERVCVYDSWKRKVCRWKHTTSGILIHSLGKTWDERFVLLFPLRNIPPGKRRGDIERGIGNYLIDKGVPILDFYSHNY